MCLSEAEGISIGQQKKELIGLTSVNLVIRPQNCSKNPLVTAKYLIKSCGKALLSYLDPYQQAPFKLSDNGCFDVWIDVCNVVSWNKE